MGHREFHADGVPMSDFQIARANLKARIAWRKHHDSRANCKDLEHRLMAVTTKQLKAENRQDRKSRKAA